MHHNPCPMGEGAGGEDIPCSLREVGIVTCLSKPLQAESGQHRLWALALLAQAQTSLGLAWIIGSLMIDNAWV
jgi:hypothetical protein